MGQGKVGCWAHRQLRPLHAGARGLACKYPMRAPPASHTQKNSKESKQMWWVGDFCLAKAQLKLLATQLSLAMLARNTWQLALVTRDPPAAV